MCEFECVCVCVGGAFCTHAARAPPQSSYTRTDGHLSHQTNISLGASMLLSQTHTHTHTHLVISVELLR